MTLDPASDERRQLDHVREDLMQEFADVPPEVVQDQLSDALRAFTRAPVRAFVPVLARRGARERLRHLE
ncbi:MAG: hypothetical protein WCD35_06185 [Mycobacteriales bacterium]